VRPTLYRALFRNYVIVTSLLLVVSGEVLFLLSLSTSGQTTSRVEASVNLAGNTLFQIGFIALLLEAINLKRWASEDILAGLLSNEDYLAKLSDRELTTQLKRVASVRFPHARDVHTTIDWLSSTLAAPTRSRYTVNIGLRKEPVVERFAGGGEGTVAPTLCVEARCTYRTDENRSNRPVPINGDGVIHSFLSAVPATTALAERHRQRTLTDADRLRWIEHVIAPQIVLDIEDRQHRVEVVPEITNVVLREAATGRLWLSFDVTCSELLMPGESAWVIYTHRQLGERHDAYVWTASARTYNFSFRARGFTGYTLVPIANPVSQSSMQDLDVSSDEIRFDGLILPESTFAFTWSTGNSAPVPTPRTAVSES
jgi:hypothetical protein